jgi:hypothetical protein
LSDKPTLFGPGVARPLPSGRVGLMNHQSKGYASSCYDYPTFEALLGDWNVRLGRFGKDEHGPFVELLPVGEGA